MSTEQDEPDGVEGLRQRLAACETRRDRALLMLREVEHRTKNVLQLASAMLSRQAEQSRSARVREPLLTAAERLATLALLHARLLQGDDHTHVNLDRYLQDLCGLLDPGGAVRIVCLAEPLACRRDIAGPLGLFAFEAVSNAIKYGYPDGQPGCIEVRLRREDGDWILCIEDDGVGRASEAHEGLGGDLMRLFAAQVEGMLETVSTPGEGCRVTLRLGGPG